MVSAVNGTIFTLVAWNSGSNTPPWNNLGGCNATADWTAPESWAVNPIDGNNSADTDAEEEDGLVVSDIYPPHQTVMTAHQLFLELHQWLRDMLPPLNQMQASAVPVRRRRFLKRILLSVAEIGRKLFNPKPPAGYMFYMKERDWT